MLDVTTAGNTASMVIDLLLAGRGRTEITLTTVAPYEARAQITPAEARLARVLVARVHA